MLKKVLTGAAALLLANAAAAQIYAVGSVGLSDFTGDDADAICRAVQECDQHGTAIKLIGGYKLSPVLAAELGYWDFGKFTTTNGAVRSVTEASGFGGGFAYHVAFAPKWSGLARLGILSMNTKLSNNFGASIEESSAQIFGGLALGYAIAPNITIDGAWDFSKATVDDASFELNAVSLGVRLTF